jgi:transcriptional regulator GlxA family with amidase domain
MKNKSASLFTYSICIFLLLVLPKSIFGQDNASPIYQCAPCGCDSDGKHFNKSGNCPSCGMKLEEVTNPNKALMKLDEPLNVAILIYHHAQVLDYAGPYDIFVAGGENFNVYTVAQTPDRVQTMPNLSINPEYSISNSPKPDIIIVPGGMWNVVSENTKMWIKDSFKDADYVLSVCTGAYILAELGLLDDLDATTHSAGVDFLERNYSSIKKVHRDVRYVDNGKIITSGGVTAGMDASFHLISKVLGDEWVKAIKTNLEYQD